MRTCEGCGDTKPEKAFSRPRGGPVARRCRDCTSRRKGNDFLFAESQSSEKDDVDLDVGFPNPGRMTELRKRLILRSLLQNPRT